MSKLNLYPLSLSLSSRRNKQEVVAILSRQYKFAIFTALIDQQLLFVLPVADDA